MRNAYLMIVLILLSGCGNHHFSGEPSKSTHADLSTFTTGLLLTVKNSLPEEEIRGRRVKPNLNAFFCAPIMASSDDRIPTTEERCIRLSGVVNNGTELTFLILREDLAKIFGLGHGRGSFEFADDHQLTPIPWPCFSPQQVKLDPNFDNRQDWHVVVNQRFSLSYGCLVDRK